jgi:hypothetical protein
VRRFKLAGRGGGLRVEEHTVINHHDPIGVLNELMDGESSVIRLNDGIRTPG